MTTTNADYKNLVDCLALHSDATTQIAEIQAAIDDHMRGEVDQIKNRFIELQTKLKSAEEAIEAIVRQNPTWFAEERSVKTPYGTVKMTRTSELITASEDNTLNAIAKADRPDLLRITTELDREALERLSDEELAEFGIIRKRGESCKITPAKVNLGKAVKSATAETAAPKKMRRAA